MCVRVVYAVALAGCSGPQYVQVAPQGADRIKSVQPKSTMPTLPPPAAHRSRAVSQLAEPARVTETSPATPIPLPPEALLIRQPEPSCKAPDSSLDERQKLDYERQCYRHAEIIVRERLDLLQGSVGKTISAVRSSGR
jgi:hypothetical protein